MTVVLIIHISGAIANIKPIFDNTTMRDIFVIYFFYHSKVIYLDIVLDEILNELTPIMKKLEPKRIPVPDVLYEYFIMRSRANLHVVLCFSPVTNFLHLC